MKADLAFLMMEFSKISDRIDALDNERSDEFDVNVKDDSMIRPINIEFTGLLKIKKLFDLYFYNMHVFYSLEKINSVNTLMMTLERGK